MDLPKISLPLALRRCGRGFSLRSGKSDMIASVSFSTLGKLPARKLSSVRSAKNRSSRFSHKLVAGA